MCDQAIKLFLWGRGQQFFLGRLYQGFMLGPFVGTQDHRLREVERPELRIDRHRQDSTRERYILGFQPGPLWSEQDCTAALRDGNFLTGLLGRDDRFRNAPFAKGGGVDMRAIRHRIGSRSKNPCTF